MFWVSDNLIRMKNASSLKRRSVKVRGTKFFLSILDVMKREGFIENYSVLNDSKQGCEVALRYYKGDSLFKQVKFVSTPKRRFYSPFEGLKSLMKDFKCVFISTNKGILSAKDAIEQGVGGEVLFWIRSY